MSAPCSHVGTIDPAAAPGADGCEDCLRSGGRWVHLRMCSACGHVGCCDSSPNKHATAHHHGTGHPLIRSFEPGEGWYWCYPDAVAFEVPGAPPAPHHP
ncbi:UBP-type zinc finger domain-containing protein [Kineococcus glutinatus]|uniref:UBP-type zinc finger domain-containing protein n=1 Tax=Kineococcus glutinatus TaxID=1070872 RepID=A0ABP9HU07_9ACTN